MAIDLNDIGQTSGNMNCTGWTLVTWIFVSCPDEDGLRN